MNGLTALVARALVGGQPGSLDYPRLAAVCGALAGAILALWLVILWIRRQVTRPTGRPDPELWGPEELRQMLASGQIDQAEYERMRLSMRERLLRRFDAQDDAGGKVRADEKNRAGDEGDGRPDPGGDEERS